jgi:carotenoid cleavage dioxygenase
MSGHFRATAFPDRPQFSGFMKPCRFEGEVQDLEVFGKIPSEIDETFYRVMPDPQFPPFIQDDPVRSTSQRLWL